MAAHKIGFYLNSSDDLRALGREARRIAELNRVLLRTAPSSLTQGCCVKQLRDGTLTLLADNPAIAAKLKQLAVRLLASYQKLRNEVSAIRVEVQVGKSATALTGMREPRRLSIETTENLRRLAEGLEESPLRQALLTLASRQRGEK
jgi:hypothetical protein